MDIGPLTCAIYIDLKEAFDTIDHNLLLAKLRPYGIDSQSLKWIDSYLKDRHERVEIDIWSIVLSYHNSDRCTTRIYNGLVIIFPVYKRSPCMH